MIRNRQRVDVLTSNKHECTRPRAMRTEREREGARDRRVASHWQLTTRHPCAAEPGASAMALCRSRAARAMQRPGGGARPRFRRRAERAVPHAETEGGARRRPAAARRGRKRRQLAPTASVDQEHIRAAEQRKRERETSRGRELVVLTSARVVFFDFSFLLGYFFFAPNRRLLCGGQDSRLLWMRMRPIQTEDRHRTTSAVHAQS